MATILTLKSKQRRMMDFYNSISQHKMIYLAVGYSDKWINNPIIPEETDDLTTYNTQVLGYQTFKDVLFAKVINNPTEEDKDTKVYYKDCYYDTISDYQQALDEGYSRIMLRFVLNKDEYFPVIDDQGNATMYNVLGMYIQVDPGNLADTYFIDNADWETRVTDRGTLELISTRSVISRSEDQTEDIIILLEF